MKRRIDLHQYRNYQRGWKYLIRIVLYVAILILLWVFMKYKLPKEKETFRMDSIEVKVYTDE